MDLFSSLRRLRFRFRDQPRPRSGQARLSLEALEARELLASGPSVIGFTPVSPQGPPLTNISVTFNEPIDSSTFTLTANQQARNNVALLLSNSGEGLQNRVRDLFQTYLRRSASDTDAIGIANELAMTSQQAQAQGAANADAFVVSQIVGGGEYFIRFGNSDPHTWLNQVYLDLYGRTANFSDPVTAGQLTTATSGDAGRLSVMHDITRNNEYERNLVAGLENKYLGTNFSRPAPTNDPGINSLVGQLDNSQITVPGIVANLLATSTYYTNDGEVTGLSAGVPSSQQTGSNPSALAFGNFSGLKDAHGQPILDLAVIDQGTNTIKIYQGRLGGGFSYTPAISLILPPNSGATALVVDDLNGDGMPDIAVANTGLDGSSNQSVSVFINTTQPGGPIRFADRQDYNGGNRPTGIVAGDIDGDNLKDLAVSDSVADASNHNVTILLGNGHLNNTFGSSSPVLFATGLTSATGVALADLNQDFIPDLAVSGTNGLAVLLNTSSVGNPSFNLQPLLTTTPTTAVAIGALDHTGIPDVVATTDANGGQVLVFQNNGAPTLPFSNPPSTFAVNASPRDVSVADLNGDGLGDIVVLNATATGGFTMLRNITTFVQPPAIEQIRFAPAVNYGSLGSNPVALALGDSNQDRMLDVALASSGSDSFAVIPALQPGIFRTSSDLAWLQATYRQLFNRTAGPGDVGSWLPSLNPASLVTLVGPVGSISPLSITNLNPSTNQTFQLTFAPQVLDGSYTLFLGVNNQGVAIHDLAGNAMNQNGNAINGEFPADRFVGSFAANTSDDGAFISGLYHDLLGGEPSGRPADTNGLLGFVSQVDSARSQVIGGITPAYVGSNENLTIIVTSLYNQFLQRNPGSVDLQAWLPGLSGGTLTEQQLAAILVGSPEYFLNEAGSNNNFWLNRAYLDVLGRPDTNDPGALNFLAQLNAAGTDPAASQQARQSIAMILVTSPEGLGRVVYDTFVRFLDRAPTATESQQWITTLQQPGVAGQLTPFQRLEVALISSSEFFVTAGNTNRSWTSALYAKLLKRSGGNPNDYTSEVGGLAVAMLNQPGYAGARSSVINAILSSPEYQGRLVIQDFQAYLHRSPSPAEVATFLAIPAMRPYTRDDTWVSLILASGEYPPSNPTATNQQWLSQVYQDLLHRSIGPNDASFVGSAVTAMNAGTETRQQVALQILAGLEYRRDLVATLFNRYLARNKLLPQTGADLEVNNVATSMLQGATQEQIVSSFLTSFEYFFLDARPHLFP
jgi:hypothetical protein